MANHALNAQTRATDTNDRAISATQPGPQSARKKKGKKNLEGLYEVLVPGSNILKVSPTASTIKQPGKPTVTVRNSDIAKFGTKKERQIPLKAYADRRGPRTCEKLVEEQIQSHIKQFARKLKGDKKMNIENEIRAAE